MDSTVSPIVAVNGREETKNKTYTPTRTSKGGWSSAVFIIFVEVAERFAYYGLAGNLITYLTNDLHEPTATAAKNVNTWIGVSSLFPIFGAFLADSYLGRFKTILLSSLIYVTGMVLLTLSVSRVIPAHHHREAVFFIALYILAVGEGGHKPCAQTFAADQFEEEKPEEKAAKSSFFNWWYSGVVAGASAAALLVIYIQDNVGWTTGFGILAGALAIGFIIFLLGIKKYRIQAPVGSPITRVLQVIVAAIRKRRVRDTHNNICYQEYDNVPGAAPEGQTKSGNLARTHQFWFLDKAMVIDETDASNKLRNPWRLCSLNQVEEVKQLIRLIPIWLSCLIFAGVFVQSSTFFTKQGSTMVRSIGPKFHVPPASLQFLSGLTILVSLPIYDRVFVPAARKLTGHPSGITTLQRIGVGLFLSVLEMVVAALVETKRLSVAENNGLAGNPKAVVPMRIWWLLPQYMISGLSDVFTIVGLQEFFYDQVPESLRSMGAAAYLSVIGIGSFINSAVISVIQAITSRHGDSWLGDNLNRAHVNYFYWVLAVLSALNMCIYVWIANGFVYKKVVSEKREEKEVSP